MKGLNAINFNAFDKDHKLRSTMMKCFRLLPDAMYLRMTFWIRNGKRLNLRNPVTYCDKINWLKLHDKHEEYTQLVDKLAVRDYIKDKLGDGYSFPLLGTWSKFDEIDFDSLPNCFALKCNHDSGSVKIIRDKSALTRSDFAELKAHFDKAVQGNPFFAGREYPYKNVKACILAEQYMESDDGEEIRDYKFLCFHGVPKIMYVYSNIDGKHYKDYFDMDYTWLPIINENEKFVSRSKEPPQKPKSFEEMKRLSAFLSKEMKHVRVDFYEIGGKVYFGEFTFFHCGGFWPMKPEEWEYRLGAWIDLEN